MNLFSQMPTTYSIDNQWIHHTWKVLDIFTPWVSFNYRDRHLNCREEIVRHRNLKVKWNLRKSLSGREGPSPARWIVSSTLWGRAAEEHLGFDDTTQLLLSIYSSTKDVSSGFPSPSNTSTVLEWGYLQIYIFKRKRRIKHFIFWGKQDMGKIDPTEILFFLI